jgi:hypothetical protein
MLWSQLLEDLLHSYKKRASPMVGFLYMTTSSMCFTKCLLWNSFGLLKTNSHLIVYPMKILRFKAFSSFDLKWIGMAVDLFLETMTLLLNTISLFLESSWTLRSMEILRPWTLMGFNDWIWQIMKRWCCKTFLLGEGFSLKESLDIMLLSLAC